MTGVAIAVDSRCPIRCEHCYFSCGPKSQDRLSDDAVARIVDECITRDDIDSVSFTGGEALLRKPLVLSMIAKATSGGLHTTLVTNGFWGVSDRLAKTYLADMKSSGLSRLTISYDYFHQKYVASRKIITILAANREFGIPCSINMAVTKSEDGLNLIKELDEMGFNVPVTRFPVVPVGQASSLPGNELFRHSAEDDKSLRCPSFELLYHFDGKVYPCCSPAIASTCLSLGSVDSLSVDEAERRLTHNQVLAYIQRVGFRDLLMECRREGLVTGDVQIVNSCDLCRMIFGDEDIARFAICYIREQVQSGDSAPIGVGRQNGFSCDA